MIECILCGEEFKRISWKHLHFKHGLTTEEYREMGGLVGSEKFCLICGNMFIPACRKQKTCSNKCGWILGGQILSGENHPNWGKHFYHSEETKQKISRNNARYWQGKKRPGVGKKIGAKLRGRENLALKGRKFPGRWNTGNFRKGTIPWNKGKTGVYSEEQLRRISEGTKHYTPRGKKHPNWKGGDREKRDRDTVSYVAWRMAVFQRDDFICQDCGQRGGRIHAHHIKSWADFPSLRFDINNGATLCIACHCRLHFKGKPNPRPKK